MPITRYHFERTRKHEWIVVKHDKGPWVTFEDHEKELKAEQQAANSAGDLVADCNVELLERDKKIKQLEEELARVNLSYDVDMRAWKERVEDLEQQIAENR